MLVWSIGGSYRFTMYPIIFCDFTRSPNNSQCAWSCSWRSARRASIPAWSKLQAPWQFLLFLPLSLSHSLTVLASQHLNISSLSLSIWQSPCNHSSKNALRLDSICRCAIPIKDSPKALVVPCLHEKAGSSVTAWCLCSPRHLRQIASVAQQDSSTC